jgi:recombinational DNA repair protein RecR
LFSCFNVTDKDVCDYAVNPLRDKNTILSGRTLRVDAFENSGVLNGCILFLGEWISPSEGITALSLELMNIEERI